MLRIRFVGNFIKIKIMALLSYRSDWWTASLYAFRRLQTSERASNDQNMPHKVIQAMTDEKALRHGLPRKIDAAKHLISYDPDANKEKIGNCRDRTLNSILLVPEDSFGLEMRRTAEEEDRDSVL